MNDGIYVQAAASTLFSSIYIIINIITLVPLSFLTGVAVTFLMATGRSRVAARLQERVISPLILKRLIIITLALLFPLEAIVNARIYSEFQATATFDQRLMALEPVISDGERRALRGEWAVMRSRADYDRIMGQMEGIARKAALALPKPFI